VYGDHKGLVEWRGVLWAEGVLAGGRVGADAVDVGGGGVGGQGLCGKGNVDGLWNDFLLFCKDSIPKRVCILSDWHTERDILKDENTEGAFGPDTRTLVPVIAVDTWTIACVPSTYAVSNWCSEDRGAVVTTFGLRMVSM